MGKLKTCSFCHKESRLFYSTPPCCGAWRCKASYNRLKCKKGTSVPKTKKVPKIKSFSDKKIKELAIYRKLRDEYINKNPLCEVCGSPNSLTLHHKKTRAYHLCDISVFMTTCFHCHEKIHREDKWARDSGYLLNSR